MRQAILDSVADWAGLAERQRRTVFAAGAAEASPAARRRSDRMLAAIDLMCDMDAARTAADNGADEQVRQLVSSRMEWWTTLLPTAEEQ